VCDVNGGFASGDWSALNLPKKVLPAGLRDADDAVPGGFVFAQRRGPAVTPSP
jgi:hypothetical protein